MDRSNTVSTSMYHGAFPKRAIMRLTGIRIISIALLACPLGVQAKSGRRPGRCPCTLRYSPLSLRPRQVMENMPAWNELQMLARTVSTSRLIFRDPRPPDRHHALPSCVRNGASPGQILLSLVNYLHDNIMVRRFPRRSIVAECRIVPARKKCRTMRLSNGATGGYAAPPDKIQFDSRISASPWRWCRRSRPRPRFIPVEWAFRRADHERRGWL